MANQTEIIEMAKQAGFPFNKYGLLQGDDMGEIDADSMFEAFAKLVEARKCKELAAKIEQMPFGDTAASFAQWIREQA